MSKNNVHPDHYKVAGRDRQDDAAAARQARSIAARPSSRERPDRMTKGFYFERPEPAPVGETAQRAQKETSSRAGAVKKTRARRDVPQKAASKAATPRRTAPAARAASSQGKKSASASARPTKKR